MQPIDGAFRSGFTHPTAATSRTAPSVRCMQSNGEPWKRRGAENRRGWIKCSTPFGINERNTKRLHARQEFSRVLNAFRHQRTKHGAGRRVGVLLKAVLNAFRHQRTKHSVLLTAMLCLSSAQRLSASTNETPAHHTRMLLALRRRAQRLSASTNETQPSRSRRRRMGRCAQRLSASTNETLGRVHTPIGLQRVLNAFRHQRTKHY